MNRKSHLMESLIGLGALLFVGSVLGFYILNAPARIVLARDGVLALR